MAWSTLTLVGAALALVGCLGDGDVNSDPDDSTMFWEAIGPIGTPCHALSPEGTAELKGQAFGEVLRNPMKAVVRRLTRNATITIDDDINLPSDCAMAPDYDVELQYHYSIAQLGTYEFDPQRAILSFDAPQGRVSATRGSLSLEGFDPTTNSLCGSFEAFFEGEGDNHVTGAFEARVYCL